MSYAALLGIPEAAGGGGTAALLAESDDLVVAGTAGTAGELIEELSGDVEIDVVVLHEQLGPLPVLDLARDLNHRFPQIGLVLLADDPSPELYRAAMKAGVREIATLPPSLEVLLEAVSNAGEWAQTIRRRLSATRNGDRSVGGRMLTVAGGKGGVGTTTIAVQLALALQRTHPDRSVCLVDFDLQAGDIRALLDLQHRRSVVDLISVAGELTTRHLDESLFPHSSGVRVLLPPPHGEDAEELDTDTARRILGGIRSRYDFVVVDVGATTTEAGAVAVELADEAVVVVTPDVPALRGANRLLGLWQRIDARRDRARLLLNRADRAREVQPDLIKRVVPADLLSTSVPAGFGDLEAAVNTGVPDRLDGRVGEAIEGLAKELTGDRSASAERTLEERIDDESGQVAVETVGMVLLISVVIALLWQMVLTGFTFVLAQHSAREGARELAVHGSSATQIEEAVVADLPSAWRAGVVQEVSGDDQVVVRLGVPMIFPGLGTAWEVSASAGAVSER